MIEVAVAVVAAYGTHLVYTGLVSRWSGLGVVPGSTRARRLGPTDRARRWMRQAGLTEVGTAEFIGVVSSLGIASAVAGYVVFGAAVPALALGGFGAATPLASYRIRREQRRVRSNEAWPRLIEEMRVRTDSLGRSIPQALFEVGARGPTELRPAFEAAHREWLLTTDFDRTLAVLKRELSDPTADAACETLLVAHEVGGAELGLRLAALAEDRIHDVQSRKDARSRQAGARLARRFVILVPIGMAVVGMQIGDGRDAYATPQGQVVVVVAIAMIAACWFWAGRVMRLPETERVFA